MDIITRQQDSVQGKHSTCNDAGAPQAVSPTKQLFRGEAYYLCGFYFQRDGRRLHRVVWEAFNGEIPDGCHIHHRDGDRANNHPSNLELLTPDEHRKEHAPESAERLRYLHSEGKLAHGLTAAAKWHGSDAGRDWHRKHYEQMHEQLHKRRGGMRQCPVCGSEFEALNGRNQYCSRACSSEARRRSGIDNVERHCALCGTGFTINRYSRTQCCSRSCAVRLMHQRRRSGQ